MAHGRAGCLCKSHEAHGLGRWLDMRPCAQLCCSLLTVAPPNALQRCDGAVVVLQGSQQLQGAGGRRLRLSHNA
jgi:hypothetical protein